MNRIDALKRVPIEPAHLPFRKLDADRYCDAREFNRAGPNFPLAWRGRKRLLNATRKCDF
jgi:hypothetical protein